MDTNPSTTLHAPIVDLAARESSDSGTDAGDQAVWVDSDDERIVVSLASNPRLRKLRIAESEDLINGKEYTKRLRRQFERLYPVPDWVNASSVARGASKKRRRQSNRHDSSDDGSADDMSVDSDDLTVQPLAALLQNTTDFLRAPSSSLTRRKLRPEIIDIQRTKDVGLAQPVSLWRPIFLLVLLIHLSSSPPSHL